MCKYLHNFLSRNKTDFYIDIHTHKSNESLEIFTVQNIFAQNYKQEYSEKNSFFSIGIHPWHLDKINIKNAFSELKKIDFTQNIIALGECGLDYIKNSNNQLEAFENQINISEEKNIPLIIHCVKAYSDILYLRKKTKAKQSWILHAFNGSLQLANQLIEAGCFLSFGEILFNSKSKAAKIFCKIPEKSFFLETDESQFSIEQIYRKASELKDIEIVKLKNLIVQNLKKVFLKNE